MRLEHGREGAIDSSYDVIVAGARCAGASTAMLLARAGLRVLVVDPARPGSDTLSTHALMRGGVLQLARWGVLDGVVRAGTPAVRRTTFHYGEDRVPVEIQPRDGVDALYAPRRTLLDSLLVQAAARAGAQVEHGLALTRLIRDLSGRVRGAAVSAAGGPEVEVRASIVVGADGLRSRVARLVGAEVEHAGQHGGACVFGYWPEVPVDGYHWHYRPDVSAGIIPTNDGETCIFAAMPTTRFHEGLGRGLEALYGEVLSEAAPEVASELKERGAAPPKLRAFPGAPGFMRRAWGPGWALVGDAGFFRDPITAHGITDALRDAELLAGAIFAGGDADLAAYQAARDAVVRPLMDITDRIASFAWDLEEVQGLHRAFSRAMGAGLEVLRTSPPVGDWRRRRPSRQRPAGV